MVDNWVIHDIWTRYFYIVKLTDLNSYSFTLLTLSHRRKYVFVCLDRFLLCTNFFVFSLKKRLVVFKNSWPLLVTTVSVTLYLWEGMTTILSFDPILKSPVTPFYIVLKFILSVFTFVGSKNFDEVLDIVKSVSGRTILIRFSVLRSLC